MFTISITNFLKDKRILQKKDGISVIEQEQLPYYEWLEYKRALYEELKEENKHAKNQQREQKNMQSQAKFKAPKFKAPKFR